MVERLALISATAGIEAPLERAARREADEVVAQDLERDGLGPFLSQWLAQPLFATLPPERAGLQERLANTAPGLASSLRRAGTGAQDSLWDRLGEIAEHRIPVLLIVGERDAKYRALAERMALVIGPGASVLIIAGSGHACHLEHPTAVARALSAFCAPAIYPVPEAPGT
jgi:pimeloyl-ACP methyl ester carboxylesterase